jgi:mitogen-activated protein kinase kinase
VDGDPPDLPDGSYSAAARDFVHKCLHKVPKLRPTYAMLLRHEWLAQLLKPPSAEEMEQGINIGTTRLETTDDGVLDTADEEVGAWVRAAIERRKNGSMGKPQKPALHAAPLDAVSSPGSEKTTLSPGADEASATAA